MLQILMKAENKSETETKSKSIITLIIVFIASLVLMGAGVAIWSFNSNSMTDEGQPLPEEILSPKSSWHQSSNSQSWVRSSEAATEDETTKNETVYKTVIEKINITYAEQKLNIKGLIQADSNCKEIHKVETSQNLEKIKINIVLQEKSNNNCDNKPQILNVEQQLELKLSPTQLEKFDELFEVDIR